MLALRDRSAILLKRYSNSFLSRQNRRGKSVTCGVLGRVLCRQSIPYYEDTTEILAIISARWLAWIEKPGREKDEADRGVRRLGTLVSPLGEAGTACTPTGAGEEKERGHSMPCPYAGEAGRLRNVV